MLLKRDYQKILESFTERLLTEFGDKIRSVILFGSVARQEANSNSDIDVLVIADIDFEGKQRIHEISYDIDLANEVYTQIIFFTAGGFKKEIALKSYCIKDVLEEGIVIYDDGTYRRICNKEPRTLSGIPRR